MKGQGNLFKQRRGRGERLMCERRKAEAEKRFQRIYARLLPKEPVQPSEKGGK